MAVLKILNRTVKYRILPFLVLMVVMVTMIVGYDSNMTGYANIMENLSIITKVSIASLD